MVLKDAAKHEQIEELIPAFALESLSAAEARQVEEHLAGCATCRAELAAYQEVAAQMALAVPQVAPSAELKQRLMSRLPQPPAPVLAPNRAVTPETPRQERFWERWFRQTPALAWASLVLVVVLGVSNLLLYQRVQQVEKANPGQFQVVRLTSSQAKASGVLVMNDEGDQGTLVVDGLRVLDAAQQYQLWVIRNGQRQSGGVFSVSDEGYGSLVVHASESLMTADGFGVTIEPAGGSPAPTGERVLAGKP